MAHYKLTNIPGPWECIPTVLGTIWSLMPWKRQALKIVLVDELGNRFEVKAYRGQVFSRRLP